MDKRIFVLAILLLIVNRVYSQHICSLTDNELNTYLCLEGYTSLNSTIKGQQIVNDILKEINIPDANFVIKPCPNIQNAGAIIWKNQRMVIFDEAFLNTLKGSSEYWFFVFVFAHEIAHHLNGHTLQASKTSYKSKQNELECDRFAGAILRKFGASKNDINYILSRIPHPVTNNSTHPTYSDRLKATQLGYDNANSQEEDLLLDLGVVDEAIYVTHGFIKYSNIARTETAKYEETGNREHLTNAVTAYHNSFGVIESPILFSELAEVYRVMGDYESAYLFFEKAYNYENNYEAEYLLWMYAVCIEAEKECKEILPKIEEIDYRNINTPILLRHLSIYYSVKDESTGKYGENTRKSLDILKKAIQILDAKDTLSTNDEDTQATIISDVGLAYLRLGEYSESLKYSNKSIDRLNEMKRKTNKVVLHEYLDKSLAIVYGNKAITEMMLKYWSECIRTCNTIEQKYPESVSYKKGSITYYKANSLFALGRYEDAVLEYSNSIKLNPEGVNNYLYRGDVYTKLGKNQLACKDYIVACGVYGNKEACLKARLYCK